jgi:ribonuclease P protein component
VRAQKAGLPVRTRHFVLLVCAREQDGPTRLGIVATKKNGNAVVRNRIKRLCRECFRHSPSLLPENIDFIVIAKTGAHELRLQEVQAEWAAAGAKLRAQCEITLRARPS